MPMKNGIKPQTCRVTIKKMVSAKPADHQTILHWLISELWSKTENTNFWTDSYISGFQKKSYSFMSKNARNQNSGSFKFQVFWGEVWGKLYKCMLGSNMPCLVHKYNSIQLPTQYRSYNPEHVSPKGLHT